MITLCKELFPILRSITGNGVRESLGIIQKIIPLQIREVPSGTQVFDWTVPKEWNVKDAYVIDLNTGEKIIDFKKSNLHLIGYAIPTDKIVDFEELNEHLFTLENQPDGIPYITSYYKERWGFCIDYNSYKKINRTSKFKVLIDSELKDGSLTFGELLIPGASEKEIFISTYICHPSMVNNELSGPAVATFLAKWILENKERKYSYRFVFIPETIGSITYLSLHLDDLKSKVIGGYNISCVGDERNYSYIPSRYGNTLSDKIALHVLDNSVKYRKYTFLDRGSDERQYCAPGVDLPICSILRTKFGDYPEYHTSLDNFDVVTEEGLRGSLEIYKKCIRLFEMNFVPKVKVLGEPQLGKRGLYPTMSTKSSGAMVRDMMNFIAYADGTNDLIDICNIIGIPTWETEDFLQKLVENGIFEVLSMSERTPREEPHIML